MISDKHLWGESWTIYRDKSVWVVGFRGKKGGESSHHVHHRMEHSIVIQKGELKLYLWPDFDYYVLPGLGSCFISSGTEHKLTFAEDTEGIETYYALPGHEIDPADIVRVSPGKAPDVVPA